MIPLGAAIVAATMLVAARTDHLGKGWFITGSGMEFVTTNAVAALVLVAAGGGRYSLDHALGFDLFGTTWLAATVAVAVVAGTAVLSPLFRAQRSSLG